jgi:Tfp pilus assembly protein PilF
MATMLRKLFTFFLAFGLAGSLLAEASLRDKMASERATAMGYSSMAKAAQKQAPKLFKRAAGAFKKALKKDPSNVMAQAGLADALTLSGEGGGKAVAGVAPLASKDGRISMEAVNKRARAAKATTGGYTSILKGNYDKAAVYFKQALELDPGYVGAQKGSKALADVKANGVKVSGDAGDDKDDEEEEEDEPKGKK